MDLSKYDLPCSKPIRFYIILKEAALSIRLLGALLKAVKAKLKPGAFRMPAMSDAAEGGRGAVLLSRHDTGVHGLVSASVTIFSHRYIYCPGPAEVREVRPRGGTLHALHPSDGAEWREIAGRRAICARSVRRMSE